MLTLLVGAETLLCFLACLTYFQRPDKLQHHETLLYVWPQLHPREGRVDSEESPFSEQVICPQCHTLSKGQMQTCDLVLCKVCKNLQKITTLIYIFLSSTASLWQIFLLFHSLCEEGGWAGMEKSNWAGGQGVGEKGGGGSAVSWNRISSYSTLTLQGLGL